MTSQKLIVLVLYLLLPAATLLENANNDIAGQKTLLFAGSDRQKSPTSIFRDTFKVRNGDQFLASGGAAEPVEVGGGDADMVADPIPEDEDVTPGQPRTVRVRQGAVVGVRRHIPQVGDVDVYMGLPYAAPPVGSQRFMPPKTPLPWRGTRKADRFGPVCPQRLPEIDLRFMSAGRMNHIKRLLKFLHPSSQSEDCLYLNIYSPASATRTSKLPVIVLIHGESLEWNAGNPYDGSILAAFGKIIFVTFNFRLGILGFLRPGEDTRNVSNFGLWDQIAALHWVKENIAEFGGNSDSITLLGQGTGAACASLLLVSPAATDLFHRAILMSGTALADWALTPDPLRITIDVADSLNCPTTGDDLAACLREKTLNELMSVRPSSGAPSSSHSQSAGLTGAAADDQLFAPPVFAPHIDGAVVPNEPLLLMETYNEIFKRYELLLGTTEWEGYHILDSVSASYGVSERARNAIFRHYTRVRFETRPDSALERILRHYGFRQSHPEPNEGYRNELLEAISDARYVAPLFKTAELHSRVNSNTFVYIFKHRTENSDYPSVEHSLGGEDIPYVFGLPLVSEMWEGRSFTAEEKKLSEFIMLRWSNFARLGQPHAQGSRRTTMSFSRKKDSDIEWPFFDYSQQKYLVLDVPPRAERLYRTAHLDFWNKQLPQLMESGWASTEMPSLPHHKKPPAGPAPWELPSRGRTSADFDQNTVQQMYERNLQKSGVVYGEVVTGQDDTPSPSLEPIQPPFYNIENGDPNINTSPPVVTGPFSQPISASTLAYGVVIVVGISFLVVNACAFRYLHYKNRRLQAEQLAQLNRNEAPEDLLRKAAPPGRLPTPPPTVAAAAAAGATAAAPAAPTPGSAPGGYVERLLRSLATAKGLRLPSSRRTNVPPPPTTVPSEIYEAVRHPESRSGRSSRNSRKDRKISTGTMDAHSKVRDWIAQEVVQRCSPGFLRRPRFGSNPAPPTLKKDGKTPDGAKTATAAKIPTVPTVPTIPRSGKVPVISEKTVERVEPKPSSSPVSKSNVSASTGSVDSSSTVTTLHRPKVEKVSVAVDATPATRSASVLQQIPIELAKSFDGGFQHDDEPPVAPQRRRSTTSITLQSPPPENIVVVPVHEDVVVVMPPSLPPGAPPPPVPPPQPLQSFTPGPPSVPSCPALTTSVVTPIPGLAKNVNVTSRDESPPHAPLPPGETLDNIRRRNYPKVLPDHPADGSAESSLSLRRQSLPPGHVLLRTAADHLTGPIKSALRHPGPPPPPRVSTLGRQPRRPEPRVVILPRITSPVQPAGDYGAIGDVQRVRVAAPPDTT